MSWFRLVFKTIIVFVLVLLAIMIIRDAKINPCEACMITFKNTKVSGVETVNWVTYNFSVSEIYEKLKQGECIIHYDYNQGYFK